MIFFPVLFVNFKDFESFVFLPSVLTSFFLATSVVFVSFVSVDVEEHPVKIILNAIAPAVKICFVFIYNTSFPDLFF